MAISAAYTARRCGVSTCFSRGKRKKSNRAKRTLRTFTLFLRGKRSEIACPRAFSLFGKKIFVVKKKYAKEEKRRFEREKWVISSYGGMTRACAGVKNTLKITLGMSHNWSFSAQSAISSARDLCRLSVLVKNTAFYCFFGDLWFPSPLDFMGRRRDGG